MRDLICDGCAAPVGVGAIEFGCRSAAFPDIPGTQRQASFGSWLFCESCAELVDADDRGGLLLRSIRLGPTARLLPPLLAFDAIAVSQEVFWENRTGSRLVLDEDRARRLRSLPAQFIGGAP